MWLRLAALKYAQIKKIRLSDEYLQEKIATTDETEVLMVLKNIAHQTSQTLFNPSVIKIQSEKVEFAKLYIRYCKGEDSASLLPDLAKFFNSNVIEQRQVFPLLFSVAEQKQIAQWIPKILETSLSDRLKIFAIAIAGLTENIPTLIQYMNSTEFAPLAAEALSMITGVNIDDEDLSLLEVEFEDEEKQQEYEELAEETFHQRYNRDNQTQSYELDLPYPDIEKVKTWWQQQQANYQTDTRYLAGKKLDQTGLEYVFNYGNQQQRKYATLHLKRLNPNIPMQSIRE